MKRLALLLLLTSCSKPYYAQKNGDLDIAVARKQARCDADPGKICELIDQFADADEIPIPNKRARYFGWFIPSNKGPGVPVALILEPKEGRLTALVLPFGRWRSGDEETAKDFLAKGSDGGCYDQYFESPDRVPYKTIQEGKSHTLHDIGMMNFLRQKGKRIFLVQLGSTPSTRITWAQNGAPVWVGELRQLD